MRTLLIICLSLAAIAIDLRADVLILHEKEVNGQWVLAVTWLNAPSEIGPAMVAIDNDPLQRRGDALAVLGGVRMQLEPIETPGEPVWVESTAQAGKYVVFWNVVGSADPSDWKTEILDGIDAAQSFIQSVKEDPTRELWDARPLLIERSWQPETPIQIKWVLVP